LYGAVAAFDVLQEKKGSRKTRSWAAISEIFVVLLQHLDHHADPAQYLDRIDWRWHYKGLSAKQKAAAKKPSQQKNYAKERDESYAAFKTALAPAAGGDEGQGDEPDVMDLVMNAATAEVGRIDEDAKIQRVEKREKWQAHQREQARKSRAKKARVVAAVAAAATANAADADADALAPTPASTGAFPPPPAPPAAAAAVAPPASEAEALAPRASTPVGAEAVDEEEHAGENARQRPPSLLPPSPPSAADARDDGPSPFFEDRLSMSVSSDPASSSEAAAAPGLEPADGAARRRMPTVVEHDRARSPSSSPLLLSRPSPPLTPPVALDTSPQAAAPRGTSSASEFHERAIFLDADAAWVPPAPVGALSSPSPSAAAPPAAAAPPVVAEAVARAPRAAAAAVGSGGGGRGGGGGERVERGGAAAAADEAAADAAWVPPAPVGALSSPSLSAAAPPAAAAPPGAAKAAARAPRAAAAAAGSGGGGGECERGVILDFDTWCECVYGQQPASPAPEAAPLAAQSARRIRAADIAFPPPISPLDEGSLTSATELRLDLADLQEMVSALDGTPFWVQSVVDAVLEVARKVAAAAPRSVEVLSRKACAFEKALSSLPTDSGNHGDHPSHLRELLGVVCEHRDKLPRIFDLLYVCNKVLVSVVEPVAHGFVPLVRDEGIDSSSRGGGGGDPSPLPDDAMQSLAHSLNVEAPKMLLAAAKAVQRTQIAEGAARPETTRWFRRTGSRGANHVHKLMRSWERWSLLERGILVRTRAALDRILPPPKKQALTPASLAPADMASSAVAMSDGDLAKLGMKRRAEFNDDFDDETSGDDDDDGDCRDGAWGPVTAPHASSPLPSAHPQPPLRRAPSPLQHGSDRGVRPRRGSSPHPPPPLHRYRHIQQMRRMQQQPCDEPRSG